MSNLHSSQLFPTGEFQQNDYGDCKMLGGGINLFLNSSSGKEYLSSLIKQDERGNYSVTFPDRPPITITPYDLADPKLAYGDPGTRILEKAALKITAMEQRVIDPMKLLIGPNAPVSIMKTTTHSEKERMQKILNSTSGELFFNSNVVNKNALTYCSTDTDQFFEMANGETIKIYAEHAYSIIPNPDGTFNVENPHDTSKPFKMTREELIVVFDEMRMSPLPGREFETPPEMQNLVNASLQVGHTFQEYENTMGPYTINYSGPTTATQRLLTEYTPAYSEALNNYSDELSKMAAQAGGNTPVSFSYKRLYPRNINDSENLKELPENPSVIKPEKANKKLAKDGGYELESLKSLLEFGNHMYGIEIFTGYEMPMTNFKLSEQSIKEILKKTEAYAKTGSGVSEQEKESIAQEALKAYRKESGRFVPYENLSSDLKNQIQSLSNISSLEKITGIELGDNQFMFSPTNLERLKSAVKKAAENGGMIDHADKDAIAELAQKLQKEQQVSYNSVPSSIQPSTEQKLR